MTTYALVLRTVDKDLRSFSEEANGFQWPERGPVSCSDWDASPRCGHGLHGLLWGQGDWSLLSNVGDAKWQVVKVDESKLVHIDARKVKFPEGEVIYTGVMGAAMGLVLADKSHIEVTVKAILAEESIDSAQIGSSGNYAKIGSSGNYAQIGSSGDSAKIGCSGKNSIVACAGFGVVIAAGPGGCFSAPWYDPRTKRNKITVAYVGLRGIKPNTLYRLNGQGKFEEVK